MSREEEIEKEFPGPFIYDSTQGWIKMGAEWADKHPSDETIKKVLNLSHKWLESIPAYDSYNDPTVEEYIKQHWNDETYNR